MAKARLVPGTVVDGFRLEELVHRGGMAQIWRVTKPDIEAPIVMKVPLLEEGESPAAIVSFEMEQMIMPRLKGPHVPKIYGLGDFSRHPYIVMERIPGHSLYRRVPEVPLPYQEVADIGFKIATALDDLHRQHVIHLDVKPSNIMFRPSGETVFIDFGLSHHRQLPDLLQEEFRVPHGTAPYMAPEQLKGVRDDPRSDQFALGVLLYFFSTGVRPFGESERLGAMKKRLWRDPHPPRKLWSDYPPWLQEIVLRCLEIEPAWRFPSAAQLAFALAHHDQLKLTARSERLRRDPWTVALKRRFHPVKTQPSPEAAKEPKPLDSAPIIAVAIDVSEEAKPINEALKTAAARVLATMPNARLACLNVLKQRYIATLDSTLDERGHSRHVDRLVALKHWAEPFNLDDSHVSYHVLEALDAASAILDYAKNNRVDQILIGARRSSLKRSLLGSVSAKVAVEAHCTVTIVRPASYEMTPNDAEPAPEKAEDAVQP